jgi:hypothetical protein
MMAQITEISYGRTFNDGNFEASRIDIKAEVGVNENFDDVFNQLQDKMQFMRNAELDYVPTLNEELPRRRRLRNGVCN